MTGNARPIPRPIPSWSRNPATTRPKPSTERTTATARVDRTVLFAPRDSDFANAPRMIVRWIASSRRQRYERGGCRPRRIRVPLWFASTSVVRVPASGDAWPVRRIWQRGGRWGRELGVARLRGSWRTWWSRRAGVNIRGCGRCGAGCCRGGLRRKVSAQGLVYRFTVFRRAIRGRAAPRYGSEQDNRSREFNPRVTRYSAEGGHRHIVHAPSFTRAGESGYACSDCEGCGVGAVAEAQAGHQVVDGVLDRVGRAVQV